MWQHHVQHMYPHCTRTPAHRVAAYDAGNCNSYTALRSNTTACAFDARCTRDVMRQTGRGDSLRFRRCSNHPFSRPPRSRPALFYQHCHHPSAPLRRSRQPATSPPAGMHARAGFAPTPPAAQKALRRRRGSSGPTHPAAHPAARKALRRRRGSSGARGVHRHRCRILFCFVVSQPLPCSVEFVPKTSKT